MNQSETTSAAGGGEPITILYTNWRGETAVRRIVPGAPARAFWFGSTEWHPEPQWLFTATDMEKGASRDFALSGIKAWGQEAVDAALAAPTAKGGTEVQREVVEGKTWTGAPCPVLAPPPPAGAAGGGLGDLASKVASAVMGFGWAMCEPSGDEEGDEQEDCRRYGMVQEAVSRLISAPTPDLGAQGEPVAWAYEFEDKPGQWSTELTLKKPVAHPFARNIRPLYEAPAAPRTGSGVSVEEIAQAKLLARNCRERAAMPEEISPATLGAAAVLLERFLALFAQAPPSGVETKGATDVG